MHRDPDRTIEKLRWRERIHDAVTLTAVISPVALFGFLRTGNPLLGLLGTASAIIPGIANIVAVVRKDRVRRGGGPVADPLARWRASGDDPVPSIRRFFADLVDAGGKEHWRLNWRFRGVDRTSDWWRYATDLLGAAYRQRWEYAADAERRALRAMETVLIERAAAMASGGLGANGHLVAAARVGGWALLMDRHLSEEERQSVWGFLQPFTELARTTDRAA